jgi:hypothetical protein
MTSYTQLSFSLKFSIDREINSVSLTLVHGSRNEMRKMSAASFHDFESSLLSRKPGQFYSLLLKYINPRDL